MSHPKFNTGWLAQQNLPEYHVVSTIHISLQEVLYVL